MLDFDLLCTDKNSKFLSQLALIFLYCFEGSETVDSIFYVLLSTGMFVGGLLGFCLDNTIRGKHMNPRMLCFCSCKCCVSFSGTPEERGLAMKPTSDKGVQTQFSSKQTEEIYGLPFGISSCLNKDSWTSKIPFLPTFVAKNERSGDSDVQESNKDVDPDAEEYDFVVEKL